VTHSGCHSWMCGGGGRVRERERDTV
jgi:hypothetical protein